MLFAPADGIYIFESADGVRWGQGKGVSPVKLLSLSCVLPPESMANGSLSSSCPL